MVDNECLAKVWKIKSIKSIREYVRSLSRLFTNLFRAFLFANNTSNGLYQELAMHPDRQARWASAMSAMASRISFDFIVQYFPLKPKNAGMVVDVGGGTGTVSVGLASCFPNIDFVVQDTPSTIASLDKSAGLQGRVRFQDYDMFTPQPVEYADIYFFRNIFHNWSDEDCIKILRNHAMQCDLVQNL